MFTYQLNYKSCGIDLIPAEIQGNNDCLLCGGCLKTCHAYKTENNPLRPNPGIVKIGFANGLMQLNPFRWAEWAFLFLLTGSAIFELTHFNLTTSFTTLLGTQGASALQPSDGIAAIPGDIILLYLILPSVIWLAPFLIMKLVNLRVSLAYYLRNLSLAYLPVLTAFFVGLAIMEMTTKIPYYKYILKDVRGVETVKAILFGQISQPGFPEWTDWVFSILLISIIIVGFFESHKVIRKLILKLDTHNHLNVLFTLPAVFMILMYLSAVIYKLY